MGKYDKWYLAIGLLAYGAFYFFLDHSVHQRFAIDWLLGINFPHQFHQLFGSVLLITGGVFALKALNIKDFTRNPYFQIYLVAVIGALVFDLFVSHLIVYDNLPAAFEYFVQIKIIPLFLGMAGGYFIYSKKGGDERAWKLGVPLGILAGVAFVQFWYGQYPIPLADGGFQNLGGITASFRDGFIHHVADFFVAYLAVSLLFKKKTFFSR